MLARRNFRVQLNSLCVLCVDGLEESIDHHFFECCFAKQCWEKQGISWVDDEDIHR